MKRESARISLRTILPMVFIALVSFAVSSCDRSVNTNQSAAITPSSESQKDPLFFIDGQLCQHLRKIHQDKKGDLWFGTNVYGLMRYNGSSLEYFDKNNGHNYSRISGFVQDSDSNMWFSSYNGLTKYDGHSFTDYTEREGLLTNESWCVAIDSKGIFWVGNSMGVSRFDGERFTTFSIPRPKVNDPNVVFSPDRIASIAEDKKGNIWFATDGFGICKYDGNAFTNFTTADGLCDNAINELMVDSKGNLWIGTYFGGISMYDGTKFTNFTKDGVIDGIEVSGLFEDSTGSIWFAAENEGVYKYDGNSFSHFDEDDGLLSNTILSIFEDREGRFWFGGWGGLFRYDGTAFTPVTDQGPWAE